MNHILFINRLLMQDTGEYPKQYYYIFVMIVSSAIILYLISVIIKYSRTFKWKVTKAIVITSHINKIDDSEGAVYEPVLMYKYKVGTQEYISGNLDPHFKVFKSSFMSIAYRFISKYHEGHIINILFDPFHPEKSCVERPGFLPVIIFLLFTLMIFMLMLAALLGIIEL